MSSGIEEDDTIQREKRKNKEEEERKNKETSEGRKEQRGGEKQKPERSTVTECCHLTVSTVTIIVMAGCSTLHMFSWIQIGTDIGLYDSLRNNTWSSYEALQFLLNPDKLFWVWVAVYGLQVIWIVSGILLIFQKTSQIYLYRKVTLLPPGVYVFMMLAGGATFSWVLLWERFDWMRYSLACIAAGATFSYIALLLSMLACRSAEPWLVIQDKTCVLILIGLLVQNGVAAMATMTSIMTNFHLSIILNLDANVSPTVTSYVSFGMNLCFLGVYFIIDTCLSDRHAQCVVTPYILVSLAFVGAYFKVTNQEKEGNDTDYDLLWILSLVGAGAAGLMLLVKIVVSVMRAHNRRVQDRSYAEEKRREAA